MLPNLKRWIVTILLIGSVSYDCFAVQYLYGGSDDSYTAVISRSEPTLLRIEGRKIRRIVGPENVFTVTPDPDTGTAFLQVAVPDRPFMSIYVIDEFGKQWRIFAQVRDVPGDAIVIKDTTPSPKKYPVDDLPLPLAVRTLITRMALNDPQVVTTMTEVPLWQEARFTLVGLIEDFNLTGEKYHLLNISQSKLILDEREFYKQGVLAVAIEKPDLAPQANTYVYVIRRTTNE